MTGRRLDELTTVVLAPNPSAMTLEGTNTYLIGAAGSGEVMLVDPGPRLPAHRTVIDAALAVLDATVATVVVTHHHHDHAEAAGWAHEWGARLHAFTPGLLPDSAATPLRDGQELAVGGVRIQALHTPGHSSDHLCLRVVDSEVLLTGDHILGRGTTVVYWPDGEMAAYVASLRRLGGMPARALYPGHGPVVDDPAAAVAAYLDHRLERERAVLDALEAGDRTAREVVARVYVEVDAALHSAAERSVGAHLDKLAREGLITVEQGVVTALRRR